MASHAQKEQVWQEPDENIPSSTEAREHGANTKHSFKTQDSTQRYSIDKTITSSTPSTSSSLPLDQNRNTAKSDIQALPNNLAAPDLYAAYSSSDSGSDINSDGESEEEEILDSDLKDSQIRQIPPVSRKREETVLTEEPASMGSGDFLIKNEHRYIDESEHFASGKGKSVARKSNNEHQADTPSTKTAIEANKVTSLEHSVITDEITDRECAICKERHKKFDRFANLQNCGHVFCVDCIEKWHDHAQTRYCPICRTPYDFYISSNLVISDDNKKLQLIDDLRRVRSQTPCKYFKAWVENAAMQHDSSFPTCPSGNSCAFSHSLNGKDYIFNKEQLEICKKEKILEDARSKLLFGSYKSTPRTDVHTVDFD